MTKRFIGKTVLITGGASGIGAACVNAFLAEGAAVASVDLRLPEARTENGVLHLAGDVSDARQATELVAATVDALGALDILVNSAGIGAVNPSENLSPEGWRRTLAVNLDGSFYMAQDLGALQEIFATIDKLEKKEIKHRSITEVEEKFFYPLAAASALLGLALLLRFTLLNASPMAVAT